MRREFIFLNDEVVSEAFNDRFCMYCEMQEVEEDLHAATCICDFDMFDTNCVRSDIAEKIQQIVEKANKEIGMLI